MANGMRWLFSPRESLQWYNHPKISNTTTIIFNCKAYYSIYLIVEIYQREATDLSIYHATIIHNVLLPHELCLAPQTNEQCEILLQQNHILNICMYLHNVDSI